MPRARTRPAQYSDLFSLPETLVGEIIDGKLYTHPRPAPKHALAASSLEMDLGTPFHRGRGGPGGWWILVEPELHLGADILVPDLAGWQRERLPRLPETAWFELRPDWVCEVLSPSTARTDRMLKMPIYAANGIPDCWLVDPNSKTLEAFRLKDGQWVLLASFVDDAEVVAKPFAAVPFALDALWEA